MKTLRVTVNGEARELSGPVSVAELLEELDLDPRTVVVELNREILRRPQLQETSINDGDSLEVVHFVGGG